MPVCRQRLPVPVEFTQYPSSPTLQGDKTANIHLFSRLKHLTFPRCSKMKSKKSKAASKPGQHGALHHIRHNVMLLLGTHAYSLRSGIVRYAREASWILDDTYTSMGIVPVWWQGDGILALITNPKDAIAQQQFSDVPLVDFSKGWISDSMPPRYRAAGMNRPRVLYDNIMIGRMAAEHFVERGFKHIALLNGGNYWMEQERIPSFRKTVEASGAKFHEIQYYHHLPRGEHHRPLSDHSSTHKWLVKTLRDLPKPVGVAVAADYIAIRVMRACDDAGLSVPEQVAILGCHNDPFICDFTPVPLSSIDDDLERIGYEGAKLLDQIMDGKRGPRAPILIPPKGVVTRMSTNVLAVPDPKVARAVRFIFEHHQENNIGTPEVAAAAGLSRSALDRAFYKYLGRSPAQEILSVRIESSKKLLLGTKLKAHEIAAQTGFSSIVHFSQAFHRITGHRPSVYRRQSSKQD
ncbi:MAG: AraC family transcriptional regulator [Pedosphaera sp.]|nr:AraC family transcriptional regulator [Pedosphaera sp.]